jgi:flavin prenyltransferase
MTTPDSTPLPVSMPPRSKPVIVGITGASGTLLGLRLVRALLNLSVPVELIFTEKSQAVCFEETGLTLKRQGDTNKGDLSRTEQLCQFLKLPLESASLLRLYGNQEIGQKPASGTYLTRGMVVIPCSMGTLAKIAQGTSDNLICRAADVTLKESRRLILVPRETPLNAIQLENMLKLSRLGVRLIPPMLAFYSEAFNSLDGQIDYTLGKVLDHLELEHTLSYRWQGMGQTRP